MGTGVNESPGSVAFGGRRTRHNSLWSKCTHLSHLVGIHAY